MARELGASPETAYYTGLGVDIAVPLAVSLGLGAERILAVRGGRFSLAAEEAAGGHTIAKHVGQTEEALRARLVAEKNIPAATSFSSLRVAEDAISDAIKSNKQAILSWAKFAKQGSRYKISYSYPTLVGFGVERATGVLRTMTKVRIVLQKTQVGSRVYFVLTAFPEP